MDKYLHFHNHTELDTSTEEYVSNWLTSNPGGKIIVGTDSREGGKHTTYATVIGLFYEGNKGAHLIYSKTKTKKYHSLIDRLWEEIMITYNTLEEIKSKTGHIASSHIDINEQEKYKSNIICNAAVGFFTGCGYSVSNKPDSWVASCAADIICNRGTS